MCDYTSWPVGVEKIRWRGSIKLARDPIYQPGSFEKLEIGAIESSEKVRAINLLSLVARKQWSGARCQYRRGRSRRRRRPRLDLGFFRNRDREVAGVSHPRNLADGEREAFRHGRGSWDDDHLVRWKSCTHTPTWRATVDES